MCHRWDVKGGREGQPPYVASLCSHTPQRSGQMGAAGSLPARPVRPRTLTDVRSAFCCQSHCSLLTVHCSLRCRCAPSGAPRVLHLLRASAPCKDEAPPPPCRLPIILNASPSTSRISRFSPSLPLPLTLKAQGGGTFAPSLRVSLFYNLFSSLFSFCSPSFFPAFLCTAGPRRRRLCRGHHCSARRARRLRPLFQEQQRGLALGPRASTPRGSAPGECKLSANPQSRSLRPSGTLIQGYSGTLRQ